MGAPPSEMAPSLNGSTRHRWAPRTVSSRYVSFQLFDNFAECPLVTPPPSSGPPGPPLPPSLSPLSLPCAPPVCPVSTFVLTDNAVRHRQCKQGRALPCIFEVVVH